MSKEVKRYDPISNDGTCGMMIEDADYGAYVEHAEYEALLAERDALLRQVDTLTGWYSNSLDVINDIAAALPGTQYMDPPDGGDVSVPEQVRRMAKDAERYRWLNNPANFHAAVSQQLWLLHGSQEFGERIDKAIGKGEQP